MEHGPASPYSGYFDIDWEPPEPALRGKVLLPLLGDQYGVVLENQELTLEVRGGEFVIRYYDTVLLKLTSPGVPDFYQGTELWDFSLADPDNRRPVDFAHRRRMLAELGHEIAHSSDLASVARRLVETKEDGRIKLFIIRQALALRRQRTLLFQAGEYRSLEAHGARAEHICAFARVRQGESLVIVVPRLLAVGGLTDPPLGREAWGDDTRVAVPADAGERFCSVLTGENIELERGALPVAAALASFPVALLVRSG
ncbi:MAG: hypothetical protein ACREKS_06880 [Candidatus Rokuibacteriota bacterium]